MMIHLFFRAPLLVIVFSLWVGCRGGEPTSSSASTDTAETDQASVPSTTDARNQDDEDQRNDETTAHAAQEQAPLDADVAAPSPTTDDITTSARHFDFQETDEELRMLLGQTPIPSFRVDDLITPTDLRDIFGPGKLGTVSPLAGQEKSSFYNDIWYHDEDESSLGFVLQYWRFRTSTAASLQYRMMEKGTLGEHQPVSLGSQAFYVSEGTQTTVTVLDYRLQAVIRLTCDTNNCHVPQLMRVYRLIEERAIE